MAQEPAAEPSYTLHLGVADLFAFAERAEEAGDLASAEAAYRALSGDPEPDYSIEARFRLGVLLAYKLKRPAEAVVLFNQILAEKPQAARVRVELARVEATLGHRRASVRALHAAEAAGLPPDVERMVRFYANALSAIKPLGGSVELSVTADNNVNRATRADTLGTVIGDFTLGNDARARGGGGFSAQAQGYFRTGLDQNAQLLVRTSLSADLHPHQGEFDDVALSLQLGPEYRLGKDRITLSGGPVLRWYGRAPYTRAIAVSGNWQHPVGRRLQLRLDGGITVNDNRRNDLQDGTVYALSAALDRQVSERFGGGLQVSANRTTARDPGYADATAGASAYAFREMKGATAVVSLSYSRLEADRRLFLYPRRRSDDRFALSASMTWRGVRLAGLAPFTRLRAERNRSTVGIYDYRRLAAELGLGSAF